MNRRFLSVLMFAFVVAGGASIVLYKLVIGRMSTNAPAATSSILVATKDLASGTVIAAADLHVAAWSGAVPEGAIVKPSASLCSEKRPPIRRNRCGIFGASALIAFWTAISPPLTLPRRPPRAPPLMPLTRSPYARPTTRALPLSPPVRVSFD